MTVKLAKAEKDKLFSLITHLKLNTDWKHNQQHMCELLKKNVPELAMSIYWTQTGESIHFSEEAQAYFEDYFQNLKRGEIVQSADLQPVHDMESCYSQSLKLDAHFLGQLFVHLDSGFSLELASQYVSPLIPQLLLARYSTEMAEEVEKRTSTDKLTGLWKRTYFNERFREETERLSRSKEIGSVAIMGLDDLGAMARMLPVDEMNGYMMTTGKTLRPLLRQTDWVVRWDHYEILFYFPNTTPESALDVFARCMQSLIQITPILQTVVGLCSTAETTSARGLIQLAARRLDLARKDGRRKLVCFASRATGLKFWEYSNHSEEE